MKQLNGLIWCILLVFIGQAQTGLIAHKSHSGSAESYSFSEFGNFGDPQPVLRIVQKINDTTVVMVHDDMGSLYNDTVYNHPLFSNPNITVDSLKKSYYYGYGVEFKNFEKKPIDDESQNALPFVNEPTHEAVPLEVKSKKQQRKEKRTKKSWMVFLLIGGGTFLGIGLTGRIVKIRKRNPHTVYA